jgi:hypothetical protein
VAKHLGNRLPQEVLSAFNGEGIESKIGRAYLLVTPDEDGTPRPCMLSAGEILAVDDGHLRVMLWPSTTTSNNLARGVRTLFCYIAPGTVIYAKGVSKPIGPGAGSKLERFEITIDAVESDVHQGMPVKETVVFGVEGMDTAKVASEWRRQLEILGS